MLKIHLMGISGSGMSGVAFLASQMGYEVTGCDLKKDGHDKSHLEGIDLLVVSPAVLYQSKLEPELIQAKEKNIVITWEEFVAKYLMKDKFVIAIAGTHGKSTTTAMVGKIMEDNGLDPTVLLGAVVPQWGKNARFGNSKYFVIEADEFNDNFLHYHPDIIVINNIEFDHPDYFKDQKQLNDSFDKFIKNLDEDGILIRESDSLKKQFNLRVLGKHNQKNANMAFLVAKKLGISDEQITKSLEGFEGIGRRMEEIGKNVFDDYAHHPSAIKTTLEGVREKYPNSRIWAIVEPHGFKRTKALLSFYKNAFDSVDKVLVGPIYKARDVVDESINPESVVKVSSHTDIKGCHSVNEILDTIRNQKKDDDIFVIMGAGNSNNWAKEISLIVNGTSFKDITTLKVGGKIKYYFEVKSKDELVEKIKFAKKNNLKVFVIGGGTDIAVSDNDFNGVVIKYIGNSSEFTVVGSYTLVTAEAGMNWDDLVKVSVDKNLQGMECLSGIPGTVGASPIQNIGAYGQELSNVFVELNAYDIENEKFVKFNKDDCKFGYRESIFKQKEYWQKYIITDITLKLNEYKDKDLELQTIRDEILRVRSEKLEDPNEIPNAGSFFKNPIVSLAKKDKILKEHPDLKYFPFNDKIKIPAGWLIEKTGWKGKSLGSVKVSDKHALIITNPEGRGGFNDVKKLADKITEDVKSMFGITLEPEVQYINI